MAQTTTRGLIGTIQGCHADMVIVDDPFKQIAEYEEFLNEHLNKALYGDVHDPYEPDIDQIAEDDEIERQIEDGEIQRQIEKYYSVDADHMPAAQLRAQLNKQLHSLTMQCVVEIVGRLEAENAELKAQLGIAEPEPVTFDVEKHSEHCSHAIGMRRDCGK